MGKQFGLLGESLKHSHSPEIHGLMGDPDYKIFEVEKEKLADFLSASRSFPREPRILLHRSK